MTLQERKESLEQEFTTLQQEEQQLLKRKQEIDVRLLEIRGAFQLLQELEKDSNSIEQ